MTSPPPNWYPDPSARPQLRYWDGVRWTEHIVPFPGSAPVTTAGPLRRGARWQGWAGLLLCATAVVAFSVPTASYERAENRDEVRLDGTTQELDLPARQTYGIYIDDADNSGYSERCSVRDDQGRTVRLRGATWSMSDSDTEMLEYVFDTGSGSLTITCSVPGERVTARPVPDVKALLVGIGVGGVVGSVGAALLIAWFVSWLQRRRRS